MSLKVSNENLDLDLAGFDAGGGEIIHYQGVPFTGILIYNYPNGNTEAEDEYIDGHKDGAQRTYYENGQMKREYYQKYNRFIKSSKRWTKDGDLIFHAEYDDNGDLVKIVVDKRPK